MSVGAVGAVGSVGGASASQSVAGSQKSSPVANSGPNKASDNQSAGMPSSHSVDKGMSTSDFVTLSQKMNESEESGMKDTKDMIKMLIALQVLEKTIEATNEIIDNFVNSG